MPCCQALTLTAASLRPNALAITPGRSPASAMILSCSCSTAVHLVTKGYRDCMSSACTDVRLRKPTHMLMAFFVRLAESGCDSTLLRLEGSMPKGDSRKPDAEHQRDSPDTSLPPTPPTASARRLGGNLGTHLRRKGEGKCHPQRLDRMPQRWRRGTLSHHSARRCGDAQANPYVVVTSSLA